MTPEDQFAKRIAETLDQSCDELRPAIQARLAEARQKALAAQCQVAPVWVAAASANSAKTSPSSILHTDWARNPVSLGLGAILVAFALAYGYATQQSLDLDAGVVAEFDSALLALDAPLDAFKDPGFLEAYSNGMLDQLATDDADTDEGTEQ